MYALERIDRVHRNQSPTVSAVGGHSAIPRVLITNEHQALHLAYHLTPMQYSSVMRLTIAAAVSTALLSSSVEAHGYLVEPQTEAIYKSTNYTGTIDTATLGAPYAGKKWDDNPTANFKVFAAAYKASGASTIRPMMDKAVPGCGNTTVKGLPVNVSGMKELVWANHVELEGFLPTHTGPCETWIDDVMVQQDINCVAKYPGYPARVPIDYSVCKKDKCTLTFYWLALHEPVWQVYKQCAPISNIGGIVGEKFVSHNLAGTTRSYVGGLNEEGTIESSGSAGSHAGSGNHSKSAGAGDVGSPAVGSQTPKPSSSATSAGLVSPVLIVMLLGAWGLEQ